MLTVYYNVSDNAYARLGVGTKLYNAALGGGGGGGGTGDALPIGIRYVFELSGA